MLHWDPKTPQTGCEIMADHVFFPTKTHRMIYPRLENHIREFNPDILFMNAEPENTQTWQAAKLCERYPDIKLVFTSWRNIDYRKIGFPYKLAFLNTMAERTVLAKAAHGIVYNNEASRIFSSIGFPHTTVIPPPVDEALFTPDKPRLIPLLSNEKFVIGYIGRLIPEKGVDTLLKAASGLSIPYELRIVGSGPALDSLQAEAHTLGINSNVRWISGIAHLEIPEALRKMDVVVLPSRTGKHWKEQFGRILIEAMACGVPVIGSDSGEIPSVIGDAGLIFPEGDVATLQTHLSDLAGNSMTRNTLRERGFARVHSEYSLDMAVKRHFSVFEALRSRR